MSDPDERLSSFDPGPAMNPLPPSDVRRHGDRLRRRNTILAGVGAAVAIAVIATPIAVLSARDDGDAVPDPAPPAPSQGVDWEQSIPDGFPLDDGMAGDSGIPAKVGDDITSGEQVLPEINICGEVAWSPSDARDLLGATWSDGVEGGEQRTLAVYDSDLAAKRALARIAADTDDSFCGNEASGNNIAALESAIGEESRSWVDALEEQGQPTGDTTVWQVARVGNALLLDKTYVPDADPAVSQAAADLLGDRAGGVIDAMCLFSTEGCESDSDPEVVTEIPDSLDIITGMAENESGEPVRASPEGNGVGVMEFCGLATFPLDGVVDRLAANASGPEYADDRELRTYASVEEAQAALDGVVTGVDACPTEDYDTTTWVHEITDGSLGDDSHTVTRTYLQDGQPTLGATSWHVVRVGNAVFVASSSSEAFPGPSYDRSVAKEANSLRPIIDSLCAFSAGGC